MPTLRLTGKFNKDLTKVISIDRFISTYLAGVPLKTYDGVALSNLAIQQYIDNATSQLETFLDIKISKQIIEQSADFYSVDWHNGFNMIKFSYPVNKAFELYGNFGDVKQISFPKDWLSVHKTNDSSGGNFRSVTIIPSSTESLQPIYFSASSLYIMNNNRGFIQNYWRCAYCTGFDRIPNNILDVICKVASMNLLSVLGDTLYKPGVPSQSISIDGLSQSFSNSSGSQGGVFAGRVRQYGEEVKQSLIDLRSYYKGLSMVVC